MSIDLSRVSAIIFWGRHSKFSVRVLSLDGMEKVLCPSNQRPCKLPLILSCGYRTPQRPRTLFLRSRERLHLNGEGQKIEFWWFP